VLAQVAGEPMCPAPDIDQAWHLPTTRMADFERSRRDLFGRFPHHPPSHGGACSGDRDESDARPTRDGTRLACAVVAAVTPAF